MNILRGLWAVIEEYWHGGDRWTRFPLLYIVLWPFALLVVSLTGWLSITSLVALTPALVLLVLLLASPVLTGALWAVDKTRQGVKALIALVGIELLAGWYLAIVPLRNDVMLIPFFILTVVAIVLLAVGLGGRFSQSATAIGEALATALVATFVILTAVFLLGGRKGVKETAKGAVEWISVPQPEPVARSCETWERQYAVIPWNGFPRDTLRVGRGEQWVIRLHPTQRSGWVILDPRARDNWTRPTNTAHMLFSDGLRITDAPGKQVERGRRNAFRTWGEGCLLVQVSG